MQKNAKFWNESFKQKKLRVLEAAGIFYILKHT